MKKTIITLGFAALAVLAGCSKTGSGEVAGSDDEAWVNDETLPVPVTFSSQMVGIGTKALVEGDVMSNLPIGIFGLATLCDNNDTDTRVDDTYSPNWAYDGYQGILMSNTRVVTGENGEVEFATPYYYPMDNAYTYSFYGYHPHVAVTYADGWYQAEFTMGQSDVMWAESHAAALSAPDEGRFGFNAAYIRRIKRATEVTDQLMPNLQFNHLLTALQFRAVTADGSDTGSIKIVGMQLNNITTKARLNIAGDSSVDPDCSLAGTIAPVEGSEGTIYVSNNEGSSVLDVTPVSEDLNGALIGTLMVLPTTEELSATVVLRAGDVTTTVRDVRFSPRASGFQAGKRYAIYVRVNNAMQVEITTGLVPWDDETGVETDPIG